MANTFKSAAGGASDQPLTSAFKKPPVTGGFLVSASPLSSSSDPPDPPRVASHTLAPLPLRDGAISVAALIDLYMAHYGGRDPSRVQRLSWWRKAIGEIRLDEVSDDQVHHAVESLSQQPSRYWAGTDADGRAINKAKKKSLAPATLNRYVAGIGAVFTWAIKKRIAPKGWAHPCRAVERRREDNEVVRFLSDDERQRLLQACRDCEWPAMYALALLALTTGARKGELLALRWRDVDWPRALAYVGRSKNGDPKSLPLVPAVVEELRRMQGRADALVFASKRRPDQPYAFKECWKGVVRAAKIRNFRFHDLRHSCASALAQDGASLLQIADVLGHRQLQMTKRYSHLTTDNKTALINQVMGGVK